MGRIPVKSHRISEELAYKMCWTCSDKHFRARTPRNDGRITTLTAHIDLHSTLLQHWLSQRFQSIRSGTALFSFQVSSGNSWEVEIAFGFAQKRERERERTWRACAPICRARRRFPTTAAVGRSRDRQLQALAWKARSAHRLRETSVEREECGERGGAHSKPPSRFVCSALLQPDPYQTCLCAWKKIKMRSLL